MLKTVGLLLLSNIFMMFAWYGHLKEKGLPYGKPFSSAGALLFLNTA